MKLLLLESRFSLLRKLWSGHTIKQLNKQAIPLKVKGRT